MAAYVAVSPGWPSGGTSMKEAGPGPSGHVVTPTSWCGHGWTLAISLDSTVRGFLHSSSPMKLIYALNARMLQA